MPSNDRSAFRFVGWRRGKGYQFQGTSITLSSSCSSQTQTCPQEGSACSASRKDSCRGPQLEPLEARYENARQEACQNAAEIFQTNCAPDDSYTRSLSSIPLPRFDLEELSLGNVLGKGRFGAVYEVRALHIRIPSEETHKRVRSSSFGSEQEQHRHFMSTHCLREPDGTSTRSSATTGATTGTASHAAAQQERDARYAVKFLKYSMANHPANVGPALYDLAMEARVLSTLLHPNIVKLRAIANQQHVFEKPRFFLIMDRLYDTLEVRIHQKWKDQQKQQGATRPMIMFGSRWRTADKNNTTQPKSGREAMPELWQERLRYAFDLSAALQYLHGLEIIYRDVKPLNIGFDIRNDIKRFDFGSAAELGSAHQNITGDGLYHLTAMTGSPRYMAPEVGIGRPYNDRCDVYSFALLLWEMLTLKMPYSNHKSVESLSKHVWQGKEERPRLPGSWSSQLRSLLQQSWTSNVHERLSMMNVKKALRNECVSSRGGDATGLEHIRRRSTFLFSTAAGLAPTNASGGGNISSPSRPSSSEKKFQDCTSHHDPSWSISKLLSKGGLTSSPSVGELTYDLTARTAGISSLSTRTIEENCQ